MRIESWRERKEIGSALGDGEIEGGGKGGGQDGRFKKLRGTPRWFGRWVW